MNEVFESQKNCDDDNENGWIAVFQRKLLPSELERLANLDIVIRERFKSDPYRYLLGRAGLQCENDYFYEVQDDARKIGLRACFDDDEVYRRLNADTNKYLRENCGAYQYSIGIRQKLVKLEEAVLEHGFYLSKSGTRKLAEVQELVSCLDLRLQEVAEDILQTAKTKLQSQ